MVRAPFRVNGAGHLCEEDRIAVVCTSPAFPEKCCSRRPLQPGLPWRDAAATPARAGGIWVKATYSKTTGKLELITYDTNKDARWTPEPHGRHPTVSMEVDRDFDGVVDRWEYYDAGGALERVGFSRANDGKVDAWAYQGADGQVAVSRYPRAATAG